MEGPSSVPRSDSSPVVGASGAAGRRSTEGPYFASPGPRNFAILAAPLFVVLGFDASVRGARLSTFGLLDWASYGASALLGASLWGALLCGALVSGRALRGAAIGVFVVFFTISLGGQAYFFEQYGAYLNTDVSRFATDFGESVLHQLWADFGNYLRAKLPFLALSLLLLFAVRRAVRLAPRGVRVARVAWLPTFLLAVFLPTRHREKQPATPDILYLNAMGGMTQTLVGLTEQSHQSRPRARRSVPVPRLTRSATPERNVVLVVLESVRADAVCVDYEPGCRKTEFSNELFPERIPLRQMRALDSTTAISLAVLWSGVGPHESRDTLHTVPLLFDYARAAGYRSAYWTSQNMMFGNVRLWVQNLGVDDFVHATMVDPESDIDLGAPERKLADFLEPRIQRLEEPFFVVLQLSNGHYPYLVDESEPMPFSPWSRSKAPEENPKFRNFYQNAIHQEDRQLARILGALRAQPFGDRTVFVVTSDHGEAFREHYQMGHTFSVFDEEVKVPAYVVAPPGTLTDAEEASLRSHRDTFLFHPDLTVTILDLFGVGQAPELAPFRARMLGESLFGPIRTEREVPMTNCAGVWSCAFENWGYMKGTRKLEARAWDPAYHCYDLALDPAEKTDLGASACAPLPERARALFGRLPGKTR